jgi:deoxycytidine triphosphate deaminase
MALSNLDILEHRNRRFVIEPFKHSSVTPIGYDLRIGYGIVLPQEKNEKIGKLDFIGMQPVRKLMIPKHHGALFVTLERVRLSGKLLGTIHGKSRYSAKGLITQSVTVDPNFGQAKNSGRLFLYFYNTSPFSIEISEKDPIATLVLSSLESETADEPETKTYEDILMHYDKSYESIHQSESRVCDPIREYLKQYETTPGETAFESGVRQMNSIRNMQALDTEDAS